MDAINDVAGYLAILVTAPAALLVGAPSYLVSAWCVTRVGHRESTLDSARSNQL